MKENISLGIAFLAIVISVVAIVSAVFVETEVDIDASSIGENELADNSVTSSKVADDAISSDKIVDNSVSMNDLTSGVIAEMTGLVEIANNSITGEKIAVGAINDTHISNIASIDPNKILGIAWTADNDGSGSGLNADTLDGVNSDQFVRNDIDRVRYYTIPACGFVGRDHDTPYRYYGQGFSLRNMDPAYASHDYYAPVNLPHDAVITKMTVNYSRGDPLSDGTITLYKSPYTVISSVDLPETSGFTNYEETLSETVNNNNQAYYVKVNLDPNDGENDVALQWVCITYTVSDPLP